MRSKKVEKDGKVVDVAAKVTLPDEFKNDAKIQ